MLVQYTKIDHNEHCRGRRKYNIKLQLTTSQRVYTLLHFEFRLSVLPFVLPLVLPLVLPIVLPFVLPFVLLFVLPSLLPFLLP